MLNSMTIKGINIMIAGGGTGGHLFPAFAIGRRLESEGANVVYIGSVYGIEKNYKKDLKDKLHLLNIKGIDRSISIKSLFNNLLFPFRFAMSYLKSIMIIIRIKPKIIIGTGGYSSGIPLLAGLLLNIKSVIHEQNSYPGITTRFLSKKVNKVFISYDSIKSRLNNSSHLFTGNPVRENLIPIDKIKACKEMNIKPNKKTIFILGGSQGSMPLNLFFIKNYKKLIEKDIQIIWQTGARQFEEIDNLIQHPNIKVKAFIKNIHIPYSCSDLVISRAGAMAIEELKKFSKAMILVPFPNAADNHQKFNALELSNNNAAKLIDQKDIQADLIDTIFQLINNDTYRETIGANANKLHNSNSLNLIVESIKEHLFDV
tara:strand:+ start:3982 stop:5097 length:1116 start_codon:yes stop_codon:yes gene_type:complete